MSWEIGYDSTWRRDIGYGVPTICDHPECNEKIDRGLAYVCTGQQPYGGDGCGLYFCAEHRSHEICDDAGEFLGHGCERCGSGKDPFDAKPDVLEWVRWKLTHESWQQWRDENPDEVEKLESERCSDCPPVGYPTDETRCTECDRRSP